MNNMLSEIFTGSQQLEYITFIFTMTSNEQLIHFFVRLPNGNGTSFSLSPNLSLQKLTFLLEQTTLQLPNSFRLIYQGKRIKNYSITLSQLGVNNNSIIHVQPLQLVQRRSSKIDVAFLLNGDKFVVQQSIHKTIWDLKQGISVVTGVSAGNQILIFLGKKLKNHRTLQHYKITSDSLLCLLIDTQQILGKHSGSIMNGQSIDLALVNSVASLQKKSSVVSKTTLFRSDSINNRNIEQVAPMQIEIHDKKQENYGFEEKFMKMDLFNSYRSPNLMGSLTFNNLYESLRPSHEKEVNESEDQDLEEIQKDVIKIPITCMDLIVGQEYKSIELDD